jgi:hypothetical protein
MCLYLLPGKLFVEEARDPLRRRREQAAFSLSLILTHLIHQPPPLPLSETYKFVRTKHHFTA